MRNIWKKSINFIYDLIFNARNLQIEEEFWNNFIETKIKKIKETGISDLNNPNKQRYYKKLLIQTKNLLGIKSLKGYKILEIGSGSGLLSLYMAREGADAALLDISKNSLIYSSLMYKQLKKVDEFLGKVRFLHCNLFLLKNSLLSNFDIVHNSGVIEHYSFKEAVEIAKIMKSLVKPDGYIIIAVPNYFSPHLISIWKKHKKGTEKYYSKKELKKILEKAGLRFVKIETSTFVYPEEFPRFIIRKCQRLENFLGKYLNLGFLYIGVGKKTD